jgi:hypothetical protein
MLITMRGEWKGSIRGRFRGDRCRSILKLCEAEVIASTSGGWRVAERAVQRTFGDERIVAIVLAAAIGRKVWTK